MASYAGRPDYLQEISALAIERHAWLERDYPNYMQQGGCLILGNCYGESRYLFCGLNPGLIGNGPQDFSIGPCAVPPLNYPFRNSEEQNRELCYLRNCQTFLDAHQDLATWFSNGVTSTYLSPWRSENVPAWWQLNRDTEKQVFSYSVEILTRMLEHHDAQLLVVAGVKAVSLLERFFGHGSVHVDQALRAMAVGAATPSNVYQWSRSQLTTRNRALTVLQVPHFSFANCPAYMDQCANWLRVQLEDFR